MTLFLLILASYILGKRRARQCFEAARQAELNQATQRGIEIGRKLATAVLNKH